MRRAKVKQSWLATATLAVIGPLFATAAFAGVNRWTSSGPDVSGVSRLAIDPMNPSVVYAGTARGVFKSSNDGLSWSDPSNGELDGVNVHSLAVDPVMPSTVYAGTARGVFKSTDAGVSWSDRHVAGAIYNLVVGSQKPSTIYAGDFDDVGYYPRPSAVYKSADEGTTWSRSDSGFSIVPGTLVIDPTQPSVLYAGTYDGGGVRKSADSGSTWRLPSGDLARVSVSALAIDPQNPTTLYAATYLGVYKSVDSGSTWRLPSSDLARVSMSALAIDPQNPTTLYAGTYDGGVFRSTDSGATWREFNRGLNNRGISSLAIDRTGTRLHAGTFHDGVLDYQIVSGALDLSVGRDNKTRLVFSDADGRVVFRGVDSSGNSTSSASYGPFSGWYPIALADGPDDLTRVLWKNLDDSAALWFVRPEGVQASFRYEAIPGMAAFDVAAGAGSDTHLLWTGADGAVVLQTIDASGIITRSLPFGPYSGWTATAIADGPDGLTRLLWSNDDGRAGLSLVSSEGILATGRYRPDPGWRALDVAVGGDGLTRILATRQDDQVTLWTLWTAVAAEITPRSEIYPIYSAVPGLVPRRLAAGPDGSSRILFTGPGGSAALGLLSAGGMDEGLVPLTRTPGSGVDISGDWTGPFQTNDDADCHSDPSAGATFYQNGSDVTGSIHAIQNTCGFGGDFKGTLVGSQLTGTLTKGLFGPASVSGTVSPSEVLLIVGDLWSGNQQIPGGRLDLHR